MLLHFRSRADRIHYVTGKLYEETTFQGGEVDLLIAIVQLGLEDASDDEIRREHESKQAFHSRRKDIFAARDWFFSDRCRLILRALAIDIETMEAVLARTFDWARKDKKLVRLSEV